MGELMRENEELEHKLEKKTGFMYADLNRFSQRPWNFEYLIDALTERQEAEKIIYRLRLIRVQMRPARAGIGKWARDNGRRSDLAEVIRAVVLNNVDFADAWADKIGGV